jgi:predicted enzyme involved in methoxymalonyl-ACP biosynthesis
MSEVTTEISLVLATHEDTGAVCELITKNDAFNQTARALSSGEIDELITDRFVRVVVLRPAAATADGDPVGVVIARRRAGAVHVENFVLRDDVTGRGVEDAVLTALLHTFRAEGATVVYGVHRNAGANAPSAGFYPGHGFVAVTGIGSVKTYRHTLEELPDVPAHVDASRLMDGASA